MKRRKKDQRLLPLTKPYSRVLTTPILIDNVEKKVIKETGVIGADARQAINGAFSKQYLEGLNQKMNLLFDHFEIPRDLEDRWEILAIALAIKHVSGCESQVKTGAPEKHDYRSISKFLKFIEQEKKRRTTPAARSDVAILKSLVRSQTFQEAFPELRNLGIGRLRNLLSAGRKLRKDRAAANSNPLFLKYGGSGFKSVTKRGGG